MLDRFYVGHPSGGQKLCTSYRQVLARMCLTNSIELHLTFSSLFSLLSPPLLFCSIFCILSSSYTPLFVSFLHFPLSLLLPIVPLSIISTTKIKVLISLLRYQQLLPKFILFESSYCFAEHDGCYLNLNAVFWSKEHVLYFVFRSQSYN